MSQYHFEGGWFIDITQHSIYYVRAGVRDENEAFSEEEIKCRISMPLIRTLIPFLQENNFIQPTMSKGSREEDLKVTHRLLDILEKKLPGGST